MSKHTIEEIQAARLRLSEMSVETDGITGKLTEDAKAAGIAVQVLGEYQAMMKPQLGLSEDDLAYLEKIKCLCAAEKTGPVAWGLFDKPIPRLVDMINNLIIQRATEKTRANELESELAELKGMDTTNYICAITHYEKYGSRFTFALPSQWYGLTFGCVEAYREFQMQLVYILGEAKKKFEAECDDNFFAMESGKPQEEDA